MTEKTINCRAKVCARGFSFSHWLGANWGALFPRSRDEFARIEGSAIKIHQSIHSVRVVAESLISCWSEVGGRDAVEQ